MKEMNGTENYTDREWEELSSILSDEKNGNKDLLNRFMAEDRHNTIKYWKELKEMNSDKEIDIDKAWNKLYSRLNENGLITETPPVRKNIFRTVYFRVAAIALLLLGLGSGLLYISDKSLISRNTTVATTDNQKNLQVTLPDGSNIYLNRNTKLSYMKNFSRYGRNVTISGEAFFEIARDENNPFTVNAGNARVKVLGTSFNVITSNQDSAVEVFVKTGQVEVTDNDDSKNLILDPGFIGLVYPERTEKSVNTDPNYMAWNTGLLVYDGQTLDVVFRDLKRVYNMDIVADDREILSNTWISSIDNQSQETIIRIICASFNLSYTKDGDVYHLSGK